MKISFLINLFALTVLTACTSMGSSANGKLERWTRFDGRTIAETPLGDKQVRVIFMREKGAINGPAVNIFVDRDYLASLLEGGYRSAAICSHGEKILPSFSRNNRFTDRDSGVDYNFTMGEISYLKVVSDHAGKPVFQRVSEEEGKKILASLNQETQTLPRVNPNRLCSDPVLERIVLQAHALFKFDKSDYSNMLPEGVSEIKALSAKLRDKKLAISNIEVVGYTDPMGNTQYNQNLSEKRAETVAMLLQNLGVNNSISAQGLGESNLLVRDCLQKHEGNREARMQCDQPNRRVEIIIYGKSTLYKK